LPTRRRETPSSAASESMKLQHCARATGCRCRQIAERAAAAALQKCQYVRRGKTAQPHFDAVLPSPAPGFAWVARRTKSRLQPIIIQI